MALGKEEHIKDDNEQFSMWDSSFYGKPASFFYGLSQFVKHFFFVFVRWKIKTIETSVSFR